VIKLTKGQEPAVLADNKSTWTRELFAAKAAGDEKRSKTITKRYNHPDVKQALKKETKEKCAYCEARVTDVAHGDIEHVTARSIDIEKTFEWENLTFSCQICNQKKSAKIGIVDPYTDDPKENIFFVGAFARGKTIPGLRTVHELELNRAGLIESRNREISRYSEQLEKIHLVEDAAVKTLLLEAIKRELEGGHPEFVAMCQTLVDAFHLP
jgi:hypothetical protein